MRSLHHLSGPKAHVLALEANAACAGLALACAYSSSDEYEAEVIEARRKAGVYGPRAQRRQAAVAFAVTAILVSLVVLAGNL